MTPIVLQYAEEAAALYDTTVRDIFSPSRRAATVAARHAVCRRLHRDGIGVTDIGRLTGLDHSSVSYAVYGGDRPNKRARKLPPAPEPQQPSPGALAVQAAAAAMLEKHRREVESRY